VLALQIGVIAPVADFVLAFQDKVDIFCEVLAGGTRWFWVDRFQRKIKPVKQHLGVDFAGLRQSGLLAVVPFVPGGNWLAR